MFQESKEGFTYLPQKIEDTVTPKCLMFLPETELHNWSTKVRRSCKKIKMSELDDFDTDFIDVDVLLGMYVDEFKTFKRELTKKI